MLDTDNSNSNNNSNNNRNASNDPRRKDFVLYIIGDEILSGKRSDKHFTAITQLLESRGLRLSRAEILGDDRRRLTETFARSMAAGEVVFSFGGIGNTPDDHTRQAAAAALGVPLELHPEGMACLQARFGEAVDERRQLLVHFPRGVALIPNPYNNIPGFMAREHYFVPGFPQMSHPMIAWVLDTFYADLFHSAANRIDKALLLTGDNVYESALLDVMETLAARYPDLRLFSLPSVGNAQTRRHLELGVEGLPQRVDAAMAELIAVVESRAMAWQWRDAGRDAQTLNTPATPRS